MSLTLSQFDAEEMFRGGIVEGLEHEEDLDWEDYGKWSGGGCIFRNYTDGKYYKLSVEKERNGYISEYHLDCPEVRKVTVATTEWQEVNE